MKKALLYLAAAAMLVTSCDGDFAQPPLLLPPTVEVNPTTTVADFKADYWGSVTAPITIGMNAEGDSVIFVGRVCSSDESGNIYKNIVIQSRNDAGEQVALTFAVNNSSLYSLFPYGQEVAVYATGLSIGGYRGLLQFGNISGDQMTFMNEDLFTEHVVRTGIGLPDPTKVDTTVCTVAEINAAKADAASLRLWQSRLVRVTNVSFEDAGQPFAGTTTTNRYVVAEDGQRLNVRNSAYADFSGEILPGGSGDVTGILSYYASDWQLLLIDVEGLEGFTPYEGGEIVDVQPTGEGTAASPYNVAKALEVISAGAPDTEVYVAGKIASVSIDTTYGNAEYNIVDEGSNKALKIYRGYWLDGAKFTSADQMAVGADVVVCGKLTLYNGTPEMSTGSRVISYNGQGGSGGSGTVEGEPTGDGTAASPYNIAKALEVISAGAPESEVYVAGKIASVSIDTSYGNADYNLVDEGGTATLKIFRGYWLDGAKFTSTDQMAVGASVVVCGKLTLYNGTPEMTTGSRVISYNGQGGDTPSTPTDGNVLFSALGAELTEMPSDWTIDNVTLPEALSYIWSWKTYNEAGYLNAGAYVNSTAYATEAYAISPVIDLTGATGCSLSFDHAAKFQTTLRTLCGVLARVEGTTEWTALAIPSWPAAGSWTFANSGAVDLSAFDGKKVQVAFKYGSSTSGADTWEIKNLTITGNK